MSKPFLKLHMNANSQNHQINKTNQALSAKEQINLFQSGAQKLQGHEDNLENKFYSLEDLFAMDSADIENNVYQIIEPIELRNQ